MRNFVVAAAHAAVDLMQVMPTGAGDADRRAEETEPGTEVSELFVDLVGTPTRTRQS